MTDDGSSLVGLGSTERTVRILREQIITGHLVAGTALREEALGSDLNVSRNTLREAFRHLAAEGLVEQQLHKGAAVRRIEIAEVQDIYRLRRAIEQKAIEDSSQAAQSQIAALEQALEKSESAVRAKAWRELGTAGLRFHQSIVALLGSKKLDQFFNIVVAQLRLVFSEVQSESLFQTPWVARDRHLCELICTGRRADASNAMRLYLEQSENEILDVLRSKRWTTDRRSSDDVAASVRESEAGRRMMSRTESA